MIDRVFSALMIGLLFVGSSSALAQATPPLPNAIPAAPLRGGATPGVSQPEARLPSPPLPKAKLQGLKEDTELQERSAEIDRLRDGVRQQVQAAREAAMRFRLAKAQLEEVIAAGDCGGAPAVMRDIEFQEGEHRKLEAKLAEYCRAAGTAGTGGPLAKACAEERVRLQSDANLLRQDGNRLAKMCPGLNTQ